MIYLADTSVVLRLHEPSNPLCKIVENCIDRIARNKGEVVLVPQILVEFWVVATRPKSVNGLGLTTDEAENALESLLQTFNFLPESSKIFEEWKRLVGKYKVSGKPTHDTRIAAAMIVHKIENILTLNPQDFKRFAEINAVTPQEII